MLRGVVWWALASAVTFQRTLLCHTVQVPLTGHISDNDIDGLQIPFGASDFHNNGDNLAEWRLDKPPNVNSTGQFVFETVNSLLQHWPNTRMRNGHNIVPGTVPLGTLLYHGRSDQELPAGPEWTATDPEHSMIFCRNFNKGKGCWHVTLMTIRPLNILYFDGSSAAKVASGTMDTQDLIVWNEIRFGWMSEEWQRIADLCAWGEKYGLDGFVRMEMDFEIMLCSFTSGVKVVSFSNLADATPVRLDTWRMFEAMNAGSWHNHYPGETRIQLDLTRLVSFYDTTLAPSLVPLRFAKERWDHRLLNISKEDIARVNARLDEVLTTPSDYPTSGIDWLALIRVIVDRYAQRLELTQHLLNSTESADPTSLLQYANKTQLQLRIMLTTYILSGVMPSSPDTKGNGVDVLDWAVPMFKLCATAHTDMLLDDHPMTNSEELLFTAIQETTRQICRITTRMWAAGVLAGLDEFLNPSALEPEAEEIRDLTKTWRRDLDWLMQWLDWNVWVKCRPACGPEEMCYLTTWPIGFPKPERRRPPSHGMLDSSQRPSKATPSMLHPRDSLLLTLQKGNPQDDWERPQPRCIQVVEPYLGL